MPYCSQKIPKDTNTRYRQRLLLDEGSILPGTRRPWIAVPAVSQAGPVAVVAVSAWPASRSAAPCIGSARLHLVHRKHAPCSIRDGPVSDDGHRAAGAPRVRPEQGHRLHRARLCRPRCAGCRKLRHALRDAAAEGAARGVQAGTEGAREEEGHGRKARLQRHLEVHARGELRGVPHRPGMQSFHVFTSMDEKCDVDTFGLRAASLLCWWWTANRG